MTFLLRFQREVKDENNPVYSHKRHKDGIAYQADSL